MDKNFKILLNKERSVESIDVNSNFNINIESDAQPLPLGEVETTVNSFEQFEKERRESTIYRFYGTISPLINNALFNDNLKINVEERSGVPVITATKVVAAAIFTEGGWYGYYDDSENQVNHEQFGDNSSSLCQFKTFDPGYDRLGMLDSDGIPNYMLKITYPYAKKDIVLVENESGISLKDGIPIIDKFEVVINDRSYTALKTPINHGLEPDDEIKLYLFNDLTGGNLDLDNTTIKIFKLGNQLNDFSNRIFVVDVNPSELSITVGQSTIKRVVNDHESEYYVRSLSALTTDYVDYDIYPAAYGVNMFEDKKAAYYFKKDIDVKNIRDNLGRPLSEVFLTIVKNDNDADVTSPNHVYWTGQQKVLSDVTLHDRFWVPLKAGYLTEKDIKVNYNIRAVGANYPDGDPNFPQVHFDTNADPVVGGNLDESNNVFDGDIVEYNSYELNERRLEDIYHRINTVYREYGGEINKRFVSLGEGYVTDLSKDKREGYIYRAHLPIEIRTFSDYIEEGDTINMLGIPDYATLTYSGDTQSLPIGDIITLPLTTTSIKYRWRDLWDVGFIDATGSGVDYPFESGAHYLYLLSNFYMMRQDPPCGVAFTGEELELPGPSGAGNRDLFDDYVSRTSFYDYTVLNAFTIALLGGDVLDLTNATQPVDLSFTFIQFFGEYNLGPRDTPGGCVDLSIIETKTITDEC